MLAAVGELEQRTALPRIGSRLGPGAEEITRLKIAAVHGVVDYQLRERPVAVPEVGTHQALWWRLRLGHRRGPQRDLKRNGDASGLAIGRRIEVRQRLGIAVGSTEWGPERCERFERDDPR